MRWIRAISCLGLAAMLAALAVGGNPDGAKILIWRGCGVSKTAFMGPCAVAYEKATGVKVRLSGGGATLGIEAVADGGADLGGTCRGLLKSRHEDQLHVKLAIVAWDALVAVVHPRNPVNDITQKQLRAVLEQRVTNWKEIGGKVEPIIVVGRRGKSSGVGYSTRLLILGDTNAHYGPTVVRLNSSGPVEKLVERQPRAIAVTGVSSARKRKLKILSIDGRAPTVENIASGAYPYFRPLYIAYKPDKDPAAARFVAWLLSKPGQAEVEAQGTVTLRQGARLMARFAHFDAKPQIVNYQALVKKAARAVKK